MEFVEFTAKTVDDAITAACQKFLVTSDRLEYEVMEEVCEKEVLAFLDKLEQAGILEEV